MLMRLSIHVQEFRIITPSLEPKCCATSNPRDRNSECTALAIFFSQFLWNAKCFTSVLTRSVRRNSDKCAQENCSNSSPHPRIMHANRREWVPQGTEPFAVSSTTGSATFVFRASRWFSMIRLEYQWSGSGMLTSSSLITAPHQTDNLFPQRHGNQPRQPIQRNIR